VSLADRDRIDGTLNVVSGGRNAHTEEASGQHLGEEAEAWTGHSDGGTELSGSR
jgi:hypothetical protein